MKIISPILKPFYNIRKKTIERRYDFKINVKILASYI